MSEIEEGHDVVARHRPGFERSSGVTLFVPCDLILVCGIVAAVHAPNVQIRSLRRQHTTPSICVAHEA